jgi:hypothetical protein
MHKTILSFPKSKLFQDYIEKMIMQKEGDLIVTMAEVFHSGISGGFSLNATVNFIDYSFFMNLSYTKSEKLDFFTNCIHKPPQIALIY